MTTTVAMQSPIGFNLGLITGSPSGTVYNVNANGIVNALFADIGFFVNLGFAPTTVGARKTSFDAPLPADLISIKAAATPANGTITIAAQPVHARKLQVRIVIGTTTTTAITAGTLTLVGTDQDGNAITEVISLIENASATIVSANAYASLTSGTVAAYAAAGSGTGNTLGIGVSNDFGCPTGQGVSSFAGIKATKTTAVLGTSVTSADDVISTATIDAVARTINPTTAPAALGLINYEFSYSYQLRA